MKGFKGAYKSIFHYYNEHGSHENSFYISNIHWIHFIPNQSFMNILHGYKLVRLAYFSGAGFEITKNEEHNGKSTTMMCTTVLVFFDYFKSCSRKVIQKSWS